MPSKDVAVAESKSAINKIRGQTFAKRSNQYSFTQSRQIKALEEQRKNTQDEITKLIMILDDSSIPMEDQEITDVNEQVNKLFSNKARIESQLFDVSQGQINYGSRAGPTTHFKYFGRAKELKAKTDGEAEKKRESEKRKTFHVQEIQETDKASLVREHIGKRLDKDPANKKTRFDEDSDND